MSLHHAEDADWLALRRHAKEDVRAARDGSLSAPMPDMAVNAAGLERQGLPQALTGLAVCSRVGWPYIGQVEWDWSPMHMRIDAYYLSMCRRHRHWVLWSKGYEDNWSRWMDPSAAAVASRAGLPFDAAARLMLHDCGAQECDGGLDRLHWVNESGILDAGELAEVAAAV